MSETWLRIADPFGVDLLEYGDFVSLSYARSLNDFSPLRLALPTSFDRTLLRKDGRIQVWRQATDGPITLDTETVWFIRRWRDTSSQDGTKLLEVTAYSASYLLASRIIAYTAGSAQAVKAAPADNMMKAIVRENLGASAGAGRNISAYLSVQADLSLGVSLSKAFSRRNVLTVLQDISEQAATAGTPVYFDIVAPTPTTLEFRTYATVRGTDRGLSSASPLILSEDRGSLSGVELDDDATEEVTYAYGRGDGIQENAVIATASDAARIGSSPFGRRERLQDAGNTVSATVVLAYAQKALEEGLPRRTFRAAIVDTPSAAYGRHWFWGDVVAAEHDGITRNCTVEKIQITLTDTEGERIEARLEAND